jgi:hypothetical protein
MPKIIGKIVYLQRLAAHVPPRSIFKGGEMASR